jgi:hypothetical protein
MGAPYHVISIFQPSQSHKSTELTKRYPGPHPVITIPITTGILKLPKSELITGGVAEKKPPLPKPLKMTNTTSGPKEVESGQMRSSVTALSNRERKSVLTGPSLSHSKPQASRPTAEEKLKRATRPAPAVWDSPRVLQ